MGIFRIRVGVGMGFGGIAGIFDLPHNSAVIIIGGLLIGITLIGIIYRARPYISVLEEAFATSKYFETALSKMRS
jgi:hypothetical protein